LRSHGELPGGQSNAYAYSTGPLGASYARAESDLTWQTLEPVLFNLVGQNLSSDRHLE
jgi:hypothetical protein